MSFTEFLPAGAWREHIAAYWVRETRPEGSGRRIYADGNADLICNAGDQPVYFYPKARGKQVVPLYPGRLYLGGTMTSYGVIRCDEGCLLTGIRFWPGGFYAMFSQAMQPAVDSVIEFADTEIRTIMQSVPHLEVRLDQCFNDRFGASAVRNAGNYDFKKLRKRMYDSGGTASVQELALAMHVSMRTLQRIFKVNVGISPKDFLRIIRFQHVLNRLRNLSGDAASRDSLLGIAYDLGYSDHAHLTNEFKKYAGILPSELSHFYKTGEANNKYF